MPSENRAVDAYDLPQEPELGDLLQALSRTWRLGIRTQIPGSVLAFDPTKQTALVQVDILPVVKVTDALRLPRNILVLKGTPPNADAVLQPLQLNDVPVQIDGTQSAYVSFPILPGTTGLLHVCDRSIEAWLATGTPTDPVLAFTHALKDAVFVPGLRPITKPLALPVDLTATVVEGPAIKLGRLAVEHVTKAESLMTQLIAAVTAAATGSMDGGATFKANLIVQLQIIQAAIATISSTKAQVE